MNTLQLSNAPRNLLAVLAIVATTLWAVPQVSASDYGACNNGRCYSGSYGGSYGYSYSGYRDYGYRNGSSCNRGNVYNNFRRPVDNYPILPLETVGWTYSCSLGDYGCQGFYHPQYECWYYFYPQQQVFVPTTLIAQYPPAPIQNQNFNVNDNDNRNDNFNQNQNQNQSTNITNINIGQGVVPVQGQQIIDPQAPQADGPANGAPQVDAPPQLNVNEAPLPPQLPSQPAVNGNGNSAQPVPLPSDATVQPLSFAKRN